MYWWAIAFLIIAVLAAILGFGGILIVGIAKILFWIFIGLFIISVIVRYRQKRKS